MILYFIIIIMIIIICIFVYEIICFYYFILSYLHYHFVFGIEIQFGTSKDISYKKKYLNNNKIFAIQRNRAH